MALTEGQLGKWLEQVNRDCPEDKHWVIWHKANDCAFVCIIPPCHLKLIMQNCTVTPVAVDAISPFDALRKSYKLRSIATELSNGLFENETPVVGFKIGNQVLAAIAAKEWVKWALEWEKTQTH